MKYITRFIAVILMLVMMVGCGPLSRVPFDKTETIMQYTMVGGQALDLYSTIDALDSPNCSEGNPVFGSDPNNGILIASKVAVSVYLLYISRLTDSHTARKIILGFGTVFGLGAGIHNLSMDCD